ncbi:MAG: hypothetical protein FMNOHCHN_02283 [Ignavibacteriaceae bacterium]|nr:hypothetical protein [Ignavibacteriaceae bacterium]
MKLTNQEHSDLIGLTEMTLELEKQWDNLRKIPKRDDEKAELRKEIDINYDLLNKILSLIVKELNYSPYQNQWDDSEPLWQLEKLTPKIRETAWYNLHLSAMVGLPITLS